MILLLWSYVFGSFSVNVGCASRSFLNEKNKQTKISLAQVRSPFGPHLHWSPTDQLISDPVGIFRLYFDKCCSESDSLGDLETTKGQIESVSQTFVSSIINAPLLFSLSDPFNLFSISYIFFPSAPASHETLAALLSRFSSLVFPLTSLADPADFFPRSSTWSLYLAFSISVRMAFLWSHVNILPSRVFRISLHRFLSAPLSGLVFSSGPTSH